MTLLLGFGHRARNGKSIACDSILARCNYSGVKAHIYSIGEEVRLYCVERSTLPDIPRESLSLEQIQVLADTGKAMRESESEDFWLDRISARISADESDVALIPNIRYRNEAKFVNLEGGHNILVQRLNANGSPYISQDRDANHDSETQLHNWPWEFTLTHKEGQLWWLKAQAVNLFDFLNERRAR